MRGKKTTTWKYHENWKAVGESKEFGHLGAAKIKVLIYHLSWRFEIATLSSRLPRQAPQSHSTTSSRSLPTPPPLLPIFKRAASIQLAPKLLIFSLRRYGKIPTNLWANPVLHRKVHGCKTSAAVLAASSLCWILNQCKTGSTVLFMSGFPRAPRTVVGSQLFAVYFVSQIQLFCHPRGLGPARLLCPWDMAGNNTGVDCHFLLQGTFLTGGSNPHFISCTEGRFLTAKPSGKVLRRCTKTVC